MSTKHFTQRLQQRIRQVDFTIDMNHVNYLCTKYPARKQYVRIAQFQERIVTSDGSHGDCITLIIIDGTPITCMLSENKQRWNDGTYRVDLQ